MTGGWKAVAIAVWAVAKRLEGRGWADRSGWGGFDSPPRSGGRGGGSTTPLSSDRCDGCTVENPKHPASVHIPPPPPGAKLIVRGAKTYGTQTPVYSKRPRIEGRATVNEPWHNPHPPPPPPLSYDPPLLLTQECVFGGGMGACGSGQCSSQWRAGPVRRKWSI